MQIEWETANREIIKICDMEDKHLINTIKFLEKNDFKIKRISGGGHDIDDMWYDEDIQCKKLEYIAMCFEKLKRGL